jgi:hypothetical protein
MRYMVVNVMQLLKYHCSLYILSTFVLQAGHYLPREDWGYLAEYNRVIGGIRLMQTRSKEEKCEYALHEFYGYCQPIHTHDHHSFGYPQCDNTTNSTHGADDDIDPRNITACYDPSDYEGAVDFYHDEAFSLGKDDKLFEM